GIGAPDDPPLRFDPDAVRRRQIAHPPRAVVEPDLAVPAAHIKAVDHDIAFLVLSHNKQTTGGDPPELDAARPCSVLDVERKALSRERCARARDVPCPAARGARGT